jgi:hypothetical protein
MLTKFPYRNMHLKYLLNFKVLNTMVLIIFNYCQTVNIINPRVNNPYLFYWGSFD